MQASSSPLPKGLQLLPERFSRADNHNVAPDLAKGVGVLVKSAWDGSMITGLGDGIPLAEAIQRCSAELDAAAMAYLATMMAEMEAVVGAGNFKSEVFSKDVITAFTSLKKVDFGGMRTAHWDNIQGALSKNEDSWRSGPHKIEVFTIQQFCLRMVQFAESLRQRTGQCIDVEAEVSAPVSVPATAAAAARKQLNYKSSTRIVFGPRWPGCIIEPDWAKLYGKGNEDEDEDEDGPWLTPRMAMKIHHIAVADAESLIDIHPRLPKIARPFFKQSKAWRLAFRDCYARIGMRMQKGLPPTPNCTGEEMAFHNIMDRVPDAEDSLNDEVYNALPKYPNDDNYFDVTDLAIEDEDILMMFEDDDNGYDSSDDGDVTNVDNPILGPGSMASFALGSGGDMLRVANMHPQDWFLAFREKRFHDHEGIDMDSMQTIK